MRRREAVRRNYQSTPLTFGVTGAHSDAAVP